MTKYIDANSFLEYEENRCKNSPPLIGTCSFDNATLREELVNFLAADVEPVRHGCWEEIRDAYGQLEGWICKECGRETKSKENYCPNCGAKMNERRIK